MCLRSICSDADGKAKALIYMSLRIQILLWPQAVGRDRNNEITDIRNGNERPGSSLDRG